MGACFFPYAGQGRASGGGGNTRTTVAALVPCSTSAFFTKKLQERYVAERWLVPMDPGSLYVLVNVGIVLRSDDNLTKNSVFRVVCTIDRTSRALVLPVHYTPGNIALRLLELRCALPP